MIRGPYCYVTVTAVLKMACRPGRARCATKFGWDLNFKLEPKPEMDPGLPSPSSRLTDSNCEAWVGLRITLNGRSFRPGLEGYTIPAGQT